MRNKMKRIKTTLVFALALLTIISYSQQTPPMGWNSWNRFHENISQDLIKGIADAMKAHKLDELGYEYIVLDDGWQADSLDKDGSLLASKEKFPDGIRALTEYVNRLGFKLGIYSCPNELTCAGFPGSLNLEELHAKQFVDWGVSFLKYDYCPSRNNEKENPAKLIVDRYRIMSEALAELDSSLVFAICEKGWSGGIAKHSPGRDTLNITGEMRRKAYSWSPELGTMWRTTPDIKPRWYRLMQILDSQEGLAELAGPGSFNDPDMLEVGNGKLTLAENRAHFSLWCMLTAPLFLGNDIANMSEKILNIISNKKLIAINQDKLCIQAQKVYDNNELEVFLKPLANGDVAVCILNRGESKQLLVLNESLLGVELGRKSIMCDLWENGKPIKLNKPVAVSIKPHDVRVFKMKNIQKK